VNRPAIALLCFARSPAFFSCPCSLPSPPRAGNDDAKKSIPSSSIVILDLGSLPPYKQVSEALRASLCDPSTSRERETARLCLAAEGAALGQSSLTAGWLAKDGRAGSALDDGLGVGEDGGDVEASWALDVHEVGVWALHQSLLLVELLLESF